MAKPPSDMTMLRAVLGTQNLNPSERKAFQGMYDDLEFGKQTCLSKAQKAWVEKKFTDLNLANKPLPPPPPPRTPRERPKMPWETGDKPLKPPVRRSPSSGGENES
jgi:hypothetical protein